MRYLLLLVLLFGCTISENKFSEINDLDPVSIEIKNYKIIDLDQTNFIGVVSKWRVFEDGFIFLNNNSIFYYSNNSEQPLIINSESDFELEGCIISDFTVENRILYMLCEAKGLLVSYDLKLKKVLNTIDLGIDATRFEIFKDQIIAYQTPNTLNQDSTLNFQIFLFPLSNLKEKSKYFNYKSSLDNSYQFNVLAGDSFFKYKDKVVFSRMQNDSLVVFRDQKAGFSIEKLNFTSAPIDNGNSQDKLEDLVFYPISISVDEDYRFFSLLKNGKYFQAVTNKTTNTSILVEEVILKTDKVKVPLIAQIFNGKVYLLVTDESFIEYNSSGEFNGLFQKLKNYENSFILVSFPISELGV
ncbi:hypothetical protein [Algoriphagus marinus]|uniref:hypothetical protein n=1 Tax=Algoriphagus marinus TaxID=1925762 RepID=UPI00094B930A|nr:hypothetical protein [Algoriphagus marinus]